MESPVAEGEESPQKYEEEPSKLSIGTRNYKREFYFIIPERKTEIDFFVENVERKKTENIHRHHSARWPIPSTSRNAY